MSAKKVFWTERDEIIECWQDVQKFEEELFPVKKQDGRQFPVAAPRCVFRAGKSGRNLETSLQEKFNLNGVKKEDKVERERGLIREFQRRVALYLERGPDKDDILEWLAIMRHHGAQTRLLDWTYSFYIAVYLALNENEKGIAWALDYSRINKPEPIVKKICEQEDGFGKFSRALLHYMRKCDFLGIQQEGDKLIDLVIAWYLIEAKPPLPCVYPANPFRLNKRLSVQ